MEKQAAPHKQRHYCRATALSVISSLCSVASVAFCVHLGLYAADIQNRVVDLESVKGERALVRAPGYSVDDFNALIEQRLDDLLSQVIIRS